MKKLTIFPTTPKFSEKNHFFKERRFLTNASFLGKMLFHDSEALFSNGPLDSDPGIYTLRTFNANA